ncbi:Salicylate hydroxylase [Pyrenophora tritici-repentis]|nr:Salicylate hydroxylase [Pyrenophora tritici-repentis]KAI2484847.1 Salicylate hydroxylase [Pyrenophora tritici-repentis]
MSAYRYFLQEFNYLLCVTDGQGWDLDKAVTEKVSHEAMMADFEGPGVDDRFRQLLAKDALVLSNILSELVKSSRQEANSDANIVAGLSAYDSVRRPRAQKQLEQAAEVARIIFFQHEEAGDDIGKILPRLQQGRFD